HRPLVLVNELNPEAVRRLVDDEIVGEALELGQLLYRLLEGELGGREALLLALGDVAVEIRVRKPLVLRLVRGIGLRLGLAVRILLAVMAGGAAFIAVIAVARLAQRRAVDGKRRQRGWNRLGARLANGLSAQHPAGA